MPNLYDFLIESAEESLTITVPAYNEAIAYRKAEAIAKEKAARWKCQYQASLVKDPVAS